MTLSRSILATAASHPVLTARGDNPCALRDFGCQGTLPDARLVAILEDGTKVGTCADWVGHTQLVRASGRGSEAQQVFSWVINTFKTMNPQAVDEAGNPVPFEGIERPPNKVLDLRKRRRSRAKAVA